MMSSKVVSNILQTNNYPVAFKGHPYQVGILRHTSKQYIPIPDVRVPGTLTHNGKLNYLA